jgi:glutamate racemase
MIAFYDSGYGGLSIAAPIIKSLNQYEYLYFGDNNRAPYGERSVISLEKISSQVSEFLIEKGAKLIVLACNTLSANVLEFLQKKYPQVKFIGVIEPLFAASVKATKTKKVGFVGTRSTVKSKILEKLILENKNLHVVKKACPLLVPLVEEGWHHKPEAKMILKKYLRPLKSHQIDTLVLGCTHYPFMEKEFKKYMGKKVSVINSGETIKNYIEEFLENDRETQKSLSKKKKTTYLTSGSPEKFKEFVQRNLKMKINLEVVKF